MDQNPIRYQTVRLIGKLLHPLTESNLITIPEYREIIAQLKHLADKGTPLPTVIPKLVDQTEAATMLGISLANFKRLERVFPIQAEDGRHQRQISQFRYYQIYFDKRRNRITVNDYLVPEHIAV